MVTIAFIVGMPVFFEVGLRAARPHRVQRGEAHRHDRWCWSASRWSRGCRVVHGLVPPHPAALLAVTAYKADIGRTILYALLVGLPTAALAGPIFAQADGPLRAAARPEQPAGGRSSPRSDEVKATRPAARLRHHAVHHPAARDPDADRQLGRPVHARRTTLRQRPAASCSGNSVIALLIAALVSFYTFGKARGFDRDAILKFTNECLGPHRDITLVVGAGGGFGRVLRDSGISNAIVAAGHRGARLGAGARLAGRGA